MTPIRSRANVLWVAMDTPQARLKAARLAAGHKTAKGAAEHFGFAPTTYTAHENGQNGFGGKVAMVYAVAFNTTAEWLLVGDAEGATPPTTARPVEIDPMLLATWQKLSVRQRMRLVKIALIIAEE